MMTDGNCGFLGGSVVKYLPTNVGDGGIFLNQEDTLEGETVTHYSIHAWKIPWTEKLQRVGHHGAHTRMVARLIMVIIL